MKNYFKALLYPIAIAAAFAGITFTGCTDVDDKLGLNLLPDDQDMRFRSYTMTDGGIETYQGKGDFGYLKKLAQSSKDEFEYVLIKDAAGLPTHKTSAIRIGNMQTEGYGKIHCAFMGQLLPSGFVMIDGNTAEDYYGPNLNDENNPDPYDNIDSVMLSMTINRIFGKKEVEQKFYIYEMKELLDNDKAYYSNTDPAEYAHVDKPLFSFTLKDEKTGSLISKKLAVEPYGAEFLKRLANIQNIKRQDPDDGNKEKVPYESAKLFRNEIKGLYIAPENIFEDAAVYELIIAADNNYYYRDDYSYMFVCAQYRGKSFKNSMVERAKTDESGNVIKDENGKTVYETVPKYNDTTVTIYYSFDDYDLSLKHPSTSVGIVKHDYAGSVIDESTFYDITSDQNQQTAVTHVQGMLGVYSYMKFNEQFITELKGLLSYTDEDGKIKEFNSMMVNQAKMRIWLDEPSIPNLDAAPTRLGMYYGLIGTEKFSFSGLGSLTSNSNWKNQSSQWVADTVQTFSPNFIPDYPYMYETSEALTYGGFLARSAGYGYYEMDISMLIRLLVNTPEENLEEVNKGIWLAPIMTSSEMFSPTQVALRNDPVTESNPAGATNPKDPAYNPNIKRIKVDLVYTLMKPKE